MILVNSELDNTYECLFPTEGFRYTRQPLDEDWQDVTMVLLVGDASDVDPQLYGEKVDGAGGVHRAQDLDTFNMIREAIRRGINVLGICKGAQQMWVYLGGTLTQDIGKYVGEHWVYTTDDPPAMYSVAADHHQVMDKPPNVSILAKSEDTNYTEVFLTTEGGSRLMGIQFHPEWKDTPYFDYLMKIL